MRTRDGGVIILPKRLNVPMPELVQIFLTRGRRSRNKVSVGEPAEGSLTLTLFFFLKKKDFVHSFGGEKKGRGDWGRVFCPLSLSLLSLLPHRTTVKGE